MMSSQSEIANSEQAVKEESHQTVHNPSEVVDAVIYDPPKVGNTMERAEANPSETSIENEDQQR